MSLVEVVNNLKSFTVGRVADGPVASRLLRNHTGESAAERSEEEAKRKLALLWLDGKALAFGGSCRLGYLLDKETREELIIDE